MKWKHIVVLITLIRKHFTYHTYSKFSLEWRIEVSFCYKSRRICQSYFSNSSQFRVQLPDPWLYPWINWSACQNHVTVWLTGVTVVTTVNWANIKLIKIRTANKILSRTPKTPQIAAANTSSGGFWVLKLGNIIYGPET